MSLGLLPCPPHGDQDVDLSGDISPPTIGTKIHSLWLRAKSRMGSHFMNILSTKEWWKWSGNVVPGCWTMNQALAPYTWPPGHVPPSLTRDRGGAQAHQALLQVKPSLVSDCDSNSS